MRIEISARSNPRLKDLLARKVELIFFEGEKLVRDVLARKITVAKLLLTAELEKTLTEHSARVVERWVVSRQVLEKVSDLKNAPELIAVLDMPAWEIDFKCQKIVFGFESVQDPANLGTVFRCASAFGIAALALTGNGVRVNHPKVVRSAQTALLDIPFQVFPSQEELIEKALIHGAHVYVTGSHATERPLAVENMEFPCLVLFGNEGQGLDRQLLGRFPLLRLEQSAGIDSLNVAVSACILMYEMKRIFSL